MPDAQKRGVRFGRPKKMNEEQLQLARILLKEGSSVSEVAHTFSVHLATFYRRVVGGLILRGNMHIYRLSVFLPEIAPPIWRRVELPSETSLAKLHKVLQAAMGWQDYHLHEFEIGGKRYGVPDEEFDQPGAVVKDNTVKLSRALPRKGASLLYSYDFGDNWLTPSSSKT